MPEQRERDFEVQLEQREVLELGLNQLSDIQKTLILLRDMKAILMRRWPRWRN